MYFVLIDCLFSIVLSIATLSAVAYLVGTLIHAIIEDDLRSVGSFPLRVVPSLVVGCIYRSLVVGFIYR